MELYSNEKSDYYGSVRSDVLDFISNHNLKIDSLLEVGCGNGATLSLLKKQNQIPYVVGVDQIENIQHSNIDKYLKLDLNQDVSFDRKFSAIMSLDVFEHLYNPWKVIGNLSENLESNGYFIVSLPNILEIKALFNIVIKGDFKYQDKGVLDRTHIRFFCYKNMLDIFKDYKLVGKTNNYLQEKHFNVRKALHFLSFGLLERYLTQQYIFIFQKID